MYTAEINRKQPACLLILVDQSTSMEDPWAGTGTSKATQLALSVNHLLGNAVLLCTKGKNQIYDYFEVGVIGYRDEEARPILHGSSAEQPFLPISQVGFHPQRVEEVHRKVPDGAGGLVVEPQLTPVWIDPVASGATPMVKAVELATEAIRDWCARHPRSFPPLVINLTDGESTDGDPRDAAAELRGLATADGNVLMFNVHISGGPRTPIEFPDQDFGLDSLATQLFDMSSVLPPAMVTAATSKGYHAGAQSRGFLYNADASQMIDFLDIGTRAVMPAGLREITAPGSPR